MSTINQRPWLNNKITWLVWREEQGDAEADAREVVACDSKEAAEDFAEWDDSGGDYSIVGGSEATLQVRRAGDDAAPVETFVVSGESVPQYNARAES